MKRIVVLSLVLVGLGSARPGGAAAQVACGSGPECAAPASSRTSPGEQLFTAGMNALVGGVTAAVTRVVRGEPIDGAFWTGALGGGVVYAGKRVAVEPFAGAGLMGRELASVGASITRNAGAGRGWLEEVVLPVGPVRLYVSGDGVSPRLDVATLVASATFVVVHGARLDLPQSLSSGAVVLRGQTPMPGLTSAGAMTVWSDADIPPHERARLLAHERVHVLQYDQTFLSVDEPLERWLATRSARRSGVLEHLDLGGLTVGLKGTIGLGLPYHARPWEREAYFLGRTAHPLSAGASHTH